MPEYVPNPFGILLPKFSSPRNLKTGRGVGFLSSDKRQFTGGVTNPAFALPGVMIHQLEAHARGRMVAVFQVLLGVAVLRRLGMIRRFDPVAYTGAAYQDATASGDHQRAHRLPCNPTVAGSNIPNVPPWRMQRLREALIPPFAITDFLPKVVNYSDQRFEESGGCETLAEAVRFVIHDQPEGKPVHPGLLNHAVEFDVKKGFLAAFEAAVEKIKRHDVDPIDFFKPGEVERLNQKSIANRASTRKPTENIDAVRDALWFAAHETRIFQSNDLLADNIRTAAEALEALAKA